MIYNQHAPLTSFAQLYPDVDPARGKPLTLFERLSCAGALAILSFGCVMGDVLAAGIGLALLLFVLYLAGNQTQRRIRKEARDRFPGQQWAEDQSLTLKNLAFWMTLFWVIIIAVNLLAFWFATAESRLYFAIGAAVFTAILAWLMPGFNPLWSARRSAVKPGVAVPVSGVSNPSPQDTAEFKRVETQP